MACGVSRKDLSCDRRPGNFGARLAPDRLVAHFAAQAIKTLAVDIPLTDPAP